MSTAGIDEDCKMKDSVKPKAYWLRITIDILEVKQSEIARDLKLSTGQVSKLISCEQKNPSFDMWIARQIVEKGLLVVR